MSARAVSLSRAVPSGTDGGRKQPTRSPSSAQRPAAETALSASPNTTETTADRGVSAPVTAARCSATSTTRDASAGSRRSTPRAARAAPTAAGARPVSKMKVRALLTRCSRTRCEPSTTPPCEPSALDSVAVTTTSSRPASPNSSTSPRPPSPRTPSPCASSISNTAPCARHAPCSASRGARSPSALYTESVTTNARSSVRSARALATAATSPRSTTTTRALDNLHASTREACEPPSETMSDPFPDSATTAPRLAV